MLMLLYLRKPLWEGGEVICLSVWLLICAFLSSAASAVTHWVCEEQCPTEKEPTLRFLPTGKSYQLRPLNTRESQK